MSEYIFETLKGITWDNLASFLVWTMIILTIFEIWRIINDYEKQKKKEEIKRICIPYKMEYNKLLKEEKYEEALKFAKENGKYLKEVFYYW